MSISRKRSYSDMDSIDIQLPIQVHSRPVSTALDDQSYEMQVLNLEFGRTEDDLDQHFLITALNLGITVPRDPKTTLELVASSVSALTISSPPPESYGSPSRSSQSTNRPSYNSSEHQLPATTASSQTAPSLDSAPLGSPRPSILARSRSSSYVKIRKGLRRLSTFARRKTVNSSMPNITSPTTIMSILKSDQRPITADTFRPSPTGSVPYRRPLPSLVSLADSIPSIKPNPLQRARSKPPPTDVAKVPQLNPNQERTLPNPRLQALRTQQLTEQTRFLHFRHAQTSSLRTRTTNTLKALRTAQSASEEALHQRHTDQTTDLENRQLTAELELVRSLDTERRACDTRIKHMSAYCNNAVKSGMPHRTVTTDDHQKLIQQYHVRAGMENLHRARVNVLRERQARQLERVLKRQEVEMEGLKGEGEREEERVRVEAVKEGRALRELWGVRRERLCRRWRLAEVIERRKWEDEGGGEGVGDGVGLDIVWPMEDEEEDDGEGWMGSGCGVGNDAVGTVIC